MKCIIKYDYLFILNVSIHVLNMHVFFQAIRNLVLQLLCLLVMFLLKRDADKLHPLIVEIVDKALFTNNNNSVHQGS